MLMLRGASVFHRRALTPGRLRHRSKETKEGSVLMLCGRFPLSVVKISVAKAQFLNIVVQMNILKHILVGSLGFFALVYLLNPGAGIVEAIPDNLPLIGNLDEAAAVITLISCLKFYGVDISRLLDRNRKSG